MEFEAFIGILIPFLGTTLGAATVFFLKKMGERLSAALGGFAAGVMIAASVWSLLIPAIEWSASLGVLSPLPAVIGFAFGIAFFLVLDRIIPHLHYDGRAEGPKSQFCKNTKLTLAVAMHNLPEGVAVGIVYAWLLSGGGSVSAATALALSIGVGIQNFPEGAIISLPLAAAGESRLAAFYKGTASAVVETLGALLALALTSVFLPILPYLLGFAAGAMIYVVVEELIPESSSLGHSNLVTVFFAVGFLVMMALDILLG